MIYGSFCKHFGLAETQSLEAFLAGTDVIDVPLVAASASLGQRLCQLILAGYRAEQDGVRFQQALTTQKSVAEVFDRCRKHYPQRHELDRLHYRLPKQDRELTQLAQRIGLDVVE